MNVCLGSFCLAIVLLEKENSMQGTSYSVRVL